MATDTQEKESLAYDPALNRARQVLYRFTAIAFLDPRRGAWEELQNARRDGLVDQAAAMLREEPAARVVELARGELPIENLDPTSIWERLPSAADEFNQVYEQTFGLVVSPACPPYETEYIPSKLSFQRSQALADVSGFYTAFGWMPSRETPERHDHLTLELEFMASLIAMERQAFESDHSDRVEHAETCLAAQRRFVAEHLSWWTPAFARLLAREVAGGFYATAGEFLVALVACERALFNLPALEREAVPSQVEPLDQCDGCLLSPDA